MQATAAVFVNTVASRKPPGFLDSVYVRVALEAPAHVDAVAGPEMVTVGCCTIDTVVLLVAFVRQAGWLASMAIRLTAKEAGHVAFVLVQDTPTAVDAPSAAAGRGRAGSHVNTCTCQPNTPWLSRFITIWSHCAY